MSIKKSIFRTVGDVGIRMEDGWCALGTFMVFRMAKVVDHDHYFENGERSIHYNKGDWKSEAHCIDGMAETGREDGEFHAI